MTRRTMRHVMAWVVLGAVGCSLEPNPSPSSSETATDGTGATDGADAADATDAVDAADGFDGGDGAAADVSSPTADAGGEAPDTVGPANDTAESPDTTLTGCEATLAGPATHVVSLKMPAEVSAFECDSNADGAITPADGELNELLTGALVTALLDVNAAIAGSIADGDLTFLGSIGGDGVGFYTGVADAQCVDVTPTTDGDGEVTATAWDGSTRCAFTLDAGSVDASGCPTMLLAGATQSEGVLSGGPIEYTLAVTFAGLDLDVKVYNGVIHGNYAADPASGGFAITDGRLCGQLDYADLEATFKGACVKDPSLPLCSAEDTVLGVLKGSCLGGARCSIVTHFSSAPAAGLTKP